MRFLGLDYGKVNIGVAMSDELGILAQPLRTIKHRNAESDFAQLKKIIEEHKIEQIVVGMPINMNGTKGPAAELAQRFIQRLQSKFKLPVVSQDERLSTVQAHEILITAGRPGRVGQSGRRRKKRKHTIDSVAAAVILQEYLDCLKHPSPSAQ